MHPPHPPSSASETIVHGAAAIDLAIKSAGPAAAAIFTNPFDVAKTRLNLDRELQSSASRPHYRGTIDCILRTWDAEGMAGVQRGLSFALIREATKGVFRIGLHEPIVKRLHPSSAAPAPFYKKVLAGFGSGAIAALITNPLDLIKTRL